MELDEILSLMQNHASPFSFAELAEGELVHFAKEKLGPKHIDVERAVQKELMQRLKWQERFRREKSKQSYPKYAADYYSRLHLKYKELSLGELSKAVKFSKIIYVGDFHPLKEQKNFALDVLKDCASEKGCTLAAMECIPPCSQQRLVDYLRGKASKPPFSSDWYKPESLFRGIFDFARQKFPKVRMFGIGPEVNDKGDFSTSDDVMASLIAQNLGKCERMLVFVGNYHIASQHLPRKVEELSDEGNNVIIYQNSSALYWDMLKKAGTPAKAVQLSTNEFCVFNASPLVKYQAALDEVLDDESELAPEQKISKILAVTYLLMVVDDASLKKSLAEG